MKSAGRLTLNFSGPAIQMPTLPILDLAALGRQPARPWHAQYFAMYSSVLGGLVTDPRLMLVPVDDHLVHRGDGVFETFKCMAGRLYNLAAHLDRLETSARAIALAPPVPRADLVDIIVQTLRAGGRRDALVRLLLARGPGSLGVNPYDCPGPALYVVAYALPPPFMALHPGGARVRTVDVPVKPGFLAAIKSVNYLPNVRMKMQAADAGADFAAAFDEHGLLSEGATENIALVTRARELRVPRPGRILPGTTQQRVLELARDLVPAGRPAAIGAADLRLEDVRAAAEALIFGTTPDVTAVVEWDGRPVGDGQPGPVYQALSRRLAEDMAHNPALQTVVF